MRHRKFIKKVVRSHSPDSYIEGLMDYLSKIAKWPEVVSVTPGALTHRGGFPEFRLKYQYDTPQGIKCVAVGKTGSQHVFIVTKDRKAVIEKLQALFPEKERKPKEKVVKPPKPPTPIQTCGARSEQKCEICKLCKRCNVHQTILMRCAICPPQLEK